MSGPGFTPLTRSHRSLANPTDLHGNFTTNGTSNPTVVGGAVLSVRRLVDAGAKPFFRVALDADYILLGNHTGLAFTCASDEAFPSETNAVLCTGEITANPATTKDANEFDLAIYKAGVAVDTAGIRVDFLAKITR